MNKITVTLGNPPVLDAEERRLRALRAKEVLNGADWLFNDHISDLTRDLLGTGPADLQKREQIFQQIDAAAQIKGRLMKIIEQQEAEEKANERKHRNKRPADAE